MNNVDEKLCIQDFIVEIKNSSEKKATVNYEVVLENSCDFIISRKTAKTERILAIIVSQDLYYIKDNITNEIIKLDYESAKTFFKDLRDNYIKFKEVKWTDGINKDSFNNILDIISDSISVEMCKHNLFLPYRNMENYKTFYVNDAKLFEYIFSNISNPRNTHKYGVDFMEFTYEIKDKLGMNEARFFVDKYSVSPMESFDNSLSVYRYHTNSKTLFEFINSTEYNLEFRRLIEYVLFDMHTQGKRCITHEFWSNYRDYLSMQIKVYGCIKEKYPKHFETEHDIISLKCSLKEFEVEEEKFNLAMGKYKELEFEDSKYLIRLPQKPEDLIEEGKNLNHCVGSYGPRIVSGDCGVVFLRQRESEGKPFITVEVVNNKVVQTQGAERRRPNHEEMIFLRKWAYEKKLKIAV